MSTSPAAMTETPVEHTMLLADGRAIMFRDGGAADGFPLIALHGTPGSRLKFWGTGEVARSLGLRVIAPDRWGYGGTSPHPRPSLPAFADDIAALADRLGLARFAVMGVSGGGPYAAAVGARLGKRAAAVALVSPVGPIAGTRYAPAMTPFHRLCFNVLPRLPWTLGAAFGTFRLAINASPRLAMRLATARAAAIDKSTMCEAAVNDRLCTTFREGLRPGVGGCLTDMQLFSRPWDLDLGATRAPARVWLGTADTNVPLGPARALAAAIPDAELVELEGEGHLWVSRNYPAVLDWIAAVAHRRPQSRSGTAGRNP